MGPMNGISDWLFGLSVELTCSSFTLSMEAVSDCVASELTTDKSESMLSATEFLIGLVGVVLSVCTSDGSELMSLCEACCQPWAGGRCRIRGGRFLLEPDGDGWTCWAKFLTVLVS